MQSSSPTSNSFIPKRGPVKRSRVRSGKKIFLVSIVAYSFVFASLLAAGASVLYKNYTKTQLENEVTALNSEMDSFSVSELARVQEFDITLQKATQRALNTASIAAVLDEFDRIIARPVQVRTLSLTRAGDDQVVFDLEILTNTLDAALFQRKILVSNSQIFTDVTFSEVALQGQSAVADGEAVGSSEPKVAVMATFAVPLDFILYDPLQARQVGVDVDTAIDDFNAFAADGDLFNNPDSNDSSL